MKNCHVLRKIHFNDVRAEEYSPSRSGANSRIDFLLKNEEIVIEVKMISQSLNDKKVSEQLIIDRDRYKSHPNCKKLYCFVYDPEYMLKNPYGIEKDLSEVQQNFEFRVMVYPK